MFESPGEIAFKIGNYPIYYYGICIAFAIFLGLLTSYCICKKFFKDIDSEIILDISIPIIIGGILGARLYYCLLLSNYYSHHLIEIFQINKGGLSIHGAILGGLITGLIYAKCKKLPIPKLCDIFSFGLIVGQIIGRWGNFFNNEAFGLPCNNFLKLYIPIEKRPLNFINYDYFHPTFLYESLLNIIALAMLYFIFTKKRPKDGSIFLIYLILYSIIRIFTESIRIDSVYNIIGLPVATLMSLLMIIISLYSLLRLKNI